MLSSTDILGLITAPATAINRGRILSMSHQGRRIDNRHTAWQRDLLDDLTARPAPATSSYTHPGQAASASIRADGPLSAVEMAWLGRLPNNPAEVSFNDARALAELSGAINRTSEPIDARLVDSYWLPVRDIHDANQAQSGATNARQPLPDVPASAVNALADSILHETPDLRPDEAMARASAAVSQARDTAEAVRQTAIDQARQNLADVEGRIEQRNAVTA